VDAKAESAVWDHCCDGGKWKIQFGWQVPRELKVGVSYPIKLGMKVDSYQSGGPSGFQMNVLAPDLAEALAVQAPTPGGGERSVMFLARDYLKDREEFSITIGFVSGGVIYAYRRRCTGGGARGGRGRPRPQCRPPGSPGRAGSNARNARSSSTGGLGRRARLPIALVRRIDCCSSHRDAG